MSVWQARSLFEESRVKLCDRTSANIQSTGSVCRQVVKGSKTSDILSNSCKNFATCDSAITNSEANLKKIGLTVKNFEQQLENIDRIVDYNCHKISWIIYEKINQVLKVLYICTTDIQVDNTFYLVKNTC